MKRMTLPAGTTNRHQWHKKAARAVERVTRTFDQRRELWGTLGGDERESLVSVLQIGGGDPTNPEAVAVYDAIGARFDWLITRENADTVAEAFGEALAECVKTIPLDDNRVTPEKQADRLAERVATQEAHKVEADEKQARVDALAEDVRKQYPNAEPRGNKSRQAWAAANLKRILKARGLDCSVKSSSFSMGDSVTAHVKTPDVAPDDRKELDAIAEEFSYSTFDPMTDSSGYKRDDAGDAFRQVMGRTKYCRIEWKRSDENREAAAKFLGLDDMRGSSESHQLWSGAHPSAAAFWAQWAEDHAKPEPAAPVQGGGFTIEKHHHTKRGYDFWLVILAERVERDEYLRLRASAKAAGGWYSRKWGTTPGGYAFKEQEQAGAWAVQEFGGDDGPRGGMLRAEGRAVDKRTTAKPKQDTTKAAKFRQMAEKVAGEVAAKRAPGQENTPKRQREAMSRRIDADRLERTEQALRALADLMEAGEVPGMLRSFTSKKAVYGALGVRTVSNGYYHIGATDERTDTSPQAAALWELLEGKSPEQEQADKLAEIMAALPDKIPGYFRTPAALVQRMIDAAEIEPGHTLLEPSAGDGAILDALPDCIPAACELNGSLREVLQAKGWPLAGSDFMHFEAGAKFDRVVMNPPFENLQDIDHVRRAFDMLEDGGRLVAIMSPGPFFRQTKKAERFREWFENHGGEVETIEAGAFKESGTGVESRLVVIDKEPAELVERFKPEAPSFEISEQPSLF